MQIFISHSHNDENVAQKVASWLRAYGLDVWEASNEILPGDNWAAKISQGLQESNAMVVLLTPESLKSTWVRRDIEYALGSKRYRQRLIPVLVDPDQAIAETDIPWILKRLNIINLTKHETEEDGIRRIADTLLEVA